MVALQTQSNKQPRRGDIINTIMANTYTQLSIHVVFAVKGQENILPVKIRPELYKYISEFYE